MHKKIVSFFYFILCWSLFFNSIIFGAEPRNRKIINDWCLNITNVPDDVISGNHTVRIAVIDSGIYTDSSYLKGKIARGYNYACENTVTNDLIGHGSKIAGIILGENFQSRELVGLGSNSTIVPLVWISKYSSGVVKSGGVSALCSAIIDAVDVYDCQIINISSGITIDAPELRKAVAYAEKKGVILISAVGNTNQYAPDKIFYPAAYKTVVGVGSVNEDKHVSEFSQRNTGVMVTAPGEKVFFLSGNKSKNFIQISGTSYSTAYVSGFAALLLSKNPKMSSAEFRQILKDSSQDLGESGYDTAYGYGLIDVSRGLLLCEKNKTKK